LASGKAFLRGGKLVHKGEAEVVFFSREVHLGKETAKLTGCFPANLFAETGFVASRFERFQQAQEIEEDGLEEMPIFGAAGEEGAEAEFIAFGFVNVNDGEVALAASPKTSELVFSSRGGHIFHRTM